MYLCTCAAYLWKFELTVTMTVTVTVTVMLNHPTRILFTHEDIFISVSSIVVHAQGRMNFMCVRTCVLVYLSSLTYRG
jgi:hypothetical protein